MKKIDAFRRQRVILLAMIVVFGSACYFAQGSWSSSRRGVSGQGQEGPKPLRLENRTSAFEVVGVEKVGQRARLTLKNNYDRPITAFSLSMGMGGIDVELFPEAIAPGATHVEAFTLPPTATPESVVEVSAVVFDEEMGDGDFRFLRRITERRLGKRLAAAAIYPHLQRAAAALEDDGDLLSAVSDAKAALSTLAGPEQWMSPDVKGGFRSEKELIKIQLDELDASSRNGLDHQQIRWRLGYLKERELGKSRARPAPQQR